MRVGVPTEIKADEYRVSLTPVGARELSEHGHDVLIQHAEKVHVVLIVDSRNLVNFHLNDPRSGSDVFTVEPLAAAFPTNEGGYGNAST